jgi:MFS family permease
MSTPASSHLLARYTEPRLMPLVFALKQTSVPLALLLAGLLGPFLTGWLGWRGAMLVTAGACFVFVLMLEPGRKEFDSDRQPGYPVKLGDFATTLVAVTRAKPLRTLSFACFAFNGLQTVFTSYYVITLTQLGYSLEAAGAPGPAGHAGGGHRRRAQLRPGGRAAAAAGLCADPGHERQPRHRVPGVRAAGAGGGGDAAAAVKEASAFFFEKKNQKTFVRLRRG